MKRIFTFGVLLSVLSPAIAMQSAVAVDSTFIQVGSDWFLDSVTCRSGTGESSHPWLVENSNDLINVGRCGRVDPAQGYAPFENQNQFYKLVNDIQINGNFTNTLNLKAAGGQFLAEFDGNGKTITVERISKNLIDNVGLFSQTKNLEIKNLKIYIQNNVLGKNDVGTIVGQAFATHIENVHVSMAPNSWVLGWGGVGGLAGELREGSSIKNCSIIGQPGTVQNSLIQGTTWVGGAIGKLDESTAENVFAGAVDVLASEVAGGVIGRYIPNVDAELSGLLSDVNLIGSKTGGLVGQVDNVSNHSMTLRDSGVLGVYKSNLAAPGAFVGELIRVSSAVFRNNYSKARFMNQSAVDGATSLNGASATYLGNVFESVQGSGLNPSMASAAADLTSVSAIPDSWSLARVVNNQTVSNINQWVVSSNTNFNHGLPMPAQLFNLSVFGAVVPAPTPINSNSGSSGGGSGVPSDYGIQPVASAQKKTTSSFFRIGNKLRVTCTSGQQMRIFINGHTVARADANSEIRKIFTLKRGMNRVKFVVGRDVARVVSLNVR